MGQLRKLDDTTVLRIVERRGAGALQRVVAREFSVSQPMVSEIMSGRRYSDVTGIKAPAAPQRKSRASVRDDNILATRRRVVTVRCLVCRLFVERQAGSVLDARGVIYCSIHEGRQS